MSIISEFKEFAAKGNVIDLAVGVVIGAAFGKIVSSFVADIITPPLGLLIGGVNFNHLKVVLRDGAEGIPPVTLNYGTFLQATFDFLIVAAAIFMAVKAINRLKRAEPPKPVVVVEPPPSAEVKLLTDIRDALRNR